jgi:hypothetical protein
MRVILAVRQAKASTHTENTMNYPEMARVTQRLSKKAVGNLSSSVEVALEDIDLGSVAKPGDSVAIGVGSRGITQISTIVNETVHFLRKRGLDPFIVPAMGSHGGNTPEGQLAVLEHLGITEKTMGVPIKSGDGLVEFANLDVGLPVLMDEHAAHAQHIVVINRIKPHTKFRGPLGSGLTKMLTIGMGKGRGASRYHRAAVQYGFSILQEAARQLLKRCSVLFGLALLEDGYRQIAKVVTVTPDAWFDTEQGLLEEARSLMPTLPFDPIDILVIDEFGKNISGIGMDPHVTGRHRDIMGDYFTAPHAKRIFVRDLSVESDGNGNGIGLADVTTQRLVEALDLEKTYTNAVTAISPEKAALPIHFETDRQCLDVCLKTIGMVEPQEARIVRIKNTLTLDHLLVSKALEVETAAKSKLRIVSPWEPMAFDHDDNLMPLQGNGY